MANSFISSLETLDPTSVSNVSSLFFFMSNNGANRLISGDVMQSYLHHRLTTTVCRTTNFQITGGSAVQIAWEQEKSDPLDMWDAASNTLIAPKFTGYVQFRFGSASATGGGTYTRRRLKKNGLHVYGGGHWAYRCYNTGYVVESYSSPIECVSGDYFTFELQYQATNTVQCAGSTTFLECWPVQVYK